jgi:hypothetical protein
MPRLKKRHTDLTRLVFLFVRVSTADFRGGDAGRAQARWRWEQRRGTRLKRGGINRTRSSDTEVPFRISAPLTIGSHCPSSRVIDTSGERAAVSVEAKPSTNTKGRILIGPCSSPHRIPAARPG